MVVLRIPLVMLCIGLAANGSVAAWDFSFFNAMVEHINKYNGTGMPIYKERNNGTSSVSWTNTTASEYNDTDTTTTAPEEQECGEDQLMLLLAEKHLLNPERIVMQLTADALHEHCGEILRLLHNYNTTTVNCIPPPLDNIYMKLFRGLKFYYEQVCQEAAETFSEHHGCYKDMMADWMECQGPADWYERQDHPFVCSVFNRVSTCNYIKTSMFCDLDAAQLVWALTQSVFNIVLKEECPLIEWSDEGVRYIATAKGAHGRCLPVNLQQLLIFQSGMLLMFNFYGRY